MKLTLWITDHDFNQNIRELRHAEIQHKPHAPSFLNIVIDGLAVEASTCHVRPDGWFAYTDDVGERRVELDRVSSVTAYFK